MATIRSGGGRSIHSGVHSASRPSAARAAAIRSVTPSPVASAHGATRSSRRRSRRRCRSAPQVDHCPTRSIDGIVGIGRGEGRRRDDREVDRGRTAADARGGRGARPGVVADLDDLDPAIEDLGQRRRAEPERAPRVVDGQRDLDEQLGERTTRRTAFGGGTEQDVALPVRYVTEGREVLGHPAGKDHGDLGAAARGSRDQRGQLAQCAALIGGRRVTGPDQDAR